MPLDEPPRQSKPNPLPPASQQCDETSMTTATSGSSAVVVHVGPMPSAGQPGAGAATSIVDRIQNIDRCKWWPVCTSKPTVHE